MKRIQCRINDHFLLDKFEDLIEFNQYRDKSAVIERLMELFTNNYLDIQSRFEEQKKPKESVAVPFKGELLEHYTWDQLAALTGRTKQTIKQAICGWKDKKQSIKLINELEMLLRAAKLVKGQI